MIIWMVLFVDYVVSFELTVEGFLTSFNRANQPGGQSGCNAVPVSIVDFSFNLETVFLGTGWWCAVALGSERAASFLEIFNLKARQNGAAAWLHAG